MHSFRALVAFVAFISFVGFAKRNLKDAFMKNGVGRPTRGAEISLIVIGIRLTTDEVAEIKRAAGREPVSTWLRRKVLEVAREPAPSQGATAVDDASASRRRSPR